jgi:hypothetical protein
MKLKQLSPRRNWMRASLITLIAWGALGVLADARAALAITLPQVDDFQNGTTESWVSGGSPPPANIANGGPEGPGDRYLQVSATNFHLGTNNTTSAWTGNYTAAMVAKIIVYLNNTGPNPLEMRITLFGPGGAFTATNEQHLDPASGWIIRDFNLDASSLTYRPGSGGTGVLADTLANVTTLVFRHDSDPIDPAASGENVTAQLGIDNIRAVPEPCSTAMLAAGVAGLGLAHSARRRMR